MKTVCTWDNVACVVDSLFVAFDDALIAGAIIGLALIGAYVFASVMRSVGN